MKRALVRERDFEIGLWHITKEVRVIEETPTAIKIKKFIGSRWLPKNGIGLRVEVLPSRGNEKEG